MTCTSTTDDGFAEAIQRYATETRKRLRADGVNQYADIALSDKLKYLAGDPAIRSEEDCKNNPYIWQIPPVENGGKARVVIIGAGFGALLYAVRLIQTAGFLADDFVLIDSAWGFGGTWYWNRYPGLMCDVESSVYMPLLEETGYIPKHRYSYGPELRQYAELLAEKYGFKTRALFGCTVTETVWSEDQCRWTTTLVRKHPLQHTEETYQVRSDFIILASGPLNRPKVPRLTSLDSHTGHMFHTSRWDYAVTGGSLEDPALNLLKRKEVALLGTGATGVQLVPQLARWAGKLFVFQRTPSAVDVRGQQNISPEEWHRDVTHGQKHWQQDRRDNMAAFLSGGGKRPARNLVNDGWTQFPSVSGWVGSPATESLTAANVAEYVDDLNRLDLPRQQRIRQRVDRVIHDPVDAESLSSTLWKGSAFGFGAFRGPKISPGRSLQNRTVPLVLSLRGAGLPAASVP
ncbi:hypothetical protein ASPCAL02408 [Aspergillus calidoustus]|uniref:L-ornithine N(5)-monooxygenase n=1 Tax=Aspergillus calidoustus TaxID=454130 RepID=A0A0U5GNH3_ASPCI|nr:hypothetical protein ASPCAL02408 [Aspergillus calidoustus]